MPVICVLPCWLRDQQLVQLWLCYLRFNPLNAELNPICHLLALLEAHHILHVSRMSVNIYMFQSHITRQYSEMI